MIFLKDLYYFHTYGTILIIKLKREHIFLQSEVYETWKVIIKWLLVILDTKKIYSIFLEQIFYARKYFDETNKTSLQTMCSIKKMCRQNIEALT